MKKYNRLDKTFGPLAFSGKIILFGLLFALLYETIPSIIAKGFTVESIILSLSVLLVSAVIFFVLGFLAFTTSYTRIDYANKSSSNNSRYSPFTFNPPTPSLSPPTPLSERRILAGT